MIGDAGENPGQPRLRINTVHFGGFDQGIGDGRGLATTRRADEGEVLAPDGHGLHGAFRRVVVDLQDAMIEVGPQFPDPGQGIADRLGQFGFARNAGQLRGEPGFEIIEDRL